MSAHSEGPSLNSIFIILGATFLFGFITGVIVFLLSNSGKESDGDIETPSGFVITAKMYGGCERFTEGNCPSYQMREDGSYTFVGLNAEREREQFRGDLDSSDRRALEALLEDTDLLAVEGRLFSGTCPAHVDGVSFRYIIETESGSHSFDSCTEDLNSEKLFVMLEDYFGMFMERYDVR